jgi:hypothetical protein
LELNDIEIHVFGATAIATMSQNEKSRHGNQDFSGKYLVLGEFVFMPRSGFDITRDNLLHRYDSKLASPHSGALNARSQKDRHDCHA